MLLFLKLKWAIYLKIAHFRIQYFTSSQVEIGYLEIAHLCWGKVTFCHTKVVQIKKLNIWMMSFLMLIIILIPFWNGLSQDRPFQHVVSHIYILGCFFCPLLFQIPTANSQIQDFGEKITPAKFLENILTFH